VGNESCDNESCALAHDEEWTVSIWRSVHTTRTRGEPVAAFPIEGAVTASLVAWELEPGAMELGAEDIILPYQGRSRVARQA
jgi:hypothetical protein